MACSTAHQKPRAGVVVRYADLPRLDGRSLHGLLVAMGTDVLLGRPVIISLFGAIPVIGPELTEGSVVLPDFRHHPNPFCVARGGGAYCFVSTVVASYVARSGSNNPDVISKT